MKHRHTATICVFTAMMFAGSASASLIGDTVNVQYNFFPTVPAVAVVSPGHELPNASLATFGSINTFPRWDINIESNYITIDILATATYPLGNFFRFSDLDWVGPPGPGLVIGVTATSNQNVIPISATFTADSVRVDFGSNTANWQQGDQIRLDLQTAHVPEPVSFSLLGFGGLALIHRRRVHG
jgi:hypothetical protein